MRYGVVICAALAIGACSSVGGPYPSLHPRSAEAIDPRLQPLRPMNDRPVQQSLAAQLSALVGEAKAGDAAFSTAIGAAERRAASAAAPQSESWIVAQEALTNAIAARSPTVNAQGDIDSLEATALQTQGGIAPNDLKAIARAADEVTEISRNQTDRIDAIKKKLGI